MKTYKVTYELQDKIEPVYQYIDAENEAEAFLSTTVYLSKFTTPTKLVSIELDYDSATILDQVSDIVYNRSEEKSRQYGPFAEGMSRAAMIFNGWTGMDLKAEHVYKMLIALKFSRESYNKKHDNILDALAYLTQMYEDNKEDYNKTK